MAFTIYKSTDGSAPVLTGENGKLVDLLDACLVNGYGAQSAAGWAIAYTGTSKRVYRAASGARMYFRFDDAGPGAGAAKEARLTGYVTMSDVDTGTGEFPTSAMGVGSVAMVPVRKSTTANSTARAWIVVADARTAYVFVLTGDTASTYIGFMIGEIYSLVNADAYNGMVIGRATENSGADVEYLDRLVSNNSTHTIFHFIARGHAGAGGSVSMGAHGDYVKSGQAARFLGNSPYPNPADGAMLLSPIWITDPTTSPANGCRGRLRGLWHFCHAITNVNDLDVVSGAGDLAGKTFLILKQSQGLGVYVIETSNTLETN